jgi:creatine kinase
MGAAASISQEEIEAMPQYKIWTAAGGKIDDVKGEDGKVDLGKVEDPYLKYGGSYAGDDKDSTDFKYLSFSELPKFGPEHKSAMSRYLTPELFEKLKDVKSDKGFTLSNVIQTGVVTPHLGVGAVAGDQDCWDKFKDLFYPIIKEWHGYDAENSTHPVDLNWENLKFSDEVKAKFAKEVDGVPRVVSTRIRAARNIAGYSLPTGATAEDRAAVEGVLKQAFSGLEGELAGKYFELGALTEEETNALLEAGFLFQIPTARNLLTGAGAARSWPNNRGIFHNDNKTALCWCNEEDHCRIISMDMGGDIPSVFQRFCALSNALKESATKNGTDLMWNDKLGFMGTCPSNLGTGLRASVMVKLPKFNEIMENEASSPEDKELLETVCSAFDLQPRGSAGEHSAAKGAKFDVSNKQRLGFSEVQLVQKMIDGVSKVIDLEEKLAAGATPADIRAILAEEANGAGAAAPAAEGDAAPAAEAPAAEAPAAEAPAAEADATAAE